MSKMKKFIGVRDFYTEVKTVKKGVGGFIDLVNYLDNTEHINHKGKTEEIKSIIDNNFKERMIDRFYKRKKKDDIENKKGRPVSSLRTSWCFSIPNSENPTEEQLNGLIQDLGKKFLIIMNITLKKNYNEEKQKFEEENPGKTFEKKLFLLTSSDIMGMSKINIHYNDNIHINFMISRLLPNLESFDLSKPYYVNSMKKEFNLSIKKNIGLDKKTYIPKNEQKFNKKTYFYNEVSERKKELKEDFKKELTELKKEHKENIKELKEVNKLTNRISLYLGRFDNSSEREKKLKNKNLIMKNYEKLIEFNTDLYNLNEIENEMKKRNINTHERIQNKIKKHNIENQTQKPTQGGFDEFK